MNDKNPFQFLNPDGYKQPEDIIDLFVPVFGEYYNVPKPGHTFINGPRGSGKSMMFRFMKPDCQVLVDDNGKVLESKRDLLAINYFSLYVPIKKGHLNKTDIQINDPNGVALINEHYMVIHFAISIFNELKELNIADTVENRSALKGYYEEVFVPHLMFSGWIETDACPEGATVDEIFKRIIKTLKTISSNFQHGYLKKLIGSQSLPYNGPILLYSDFLLELLKELPNLPFLPNCPVFLLIDDADELNELQRKILNSWVAMRTTSEVSLKISTQLKYRIFSTINGSRIDTPHDYSEVNINDIYTTKKDIYYQRVEEIVTKRLKKYGAATSIPEDYFPPDLSQQKKLDEIEKAYVMEQMSKGRTEQQAKDYAYRYVVPDFIRELVGNRYTYNYGGFKQLVNVSSGIIREFIDFASEMYVLQRSKNGDKNVESISDANQNRIVNDYSDKKLESEFDKYREESTDKSELDKLRNLVMGMGGLFRIILHSEASERRVFSIALNDEPDDELRSILNLGVQYGYLQKSLIGNKDGTGKARLYILNRILAPHFGLDPSSFAGYKFMPSSTLKKSLESPKRFIDAMRPKIKGAKNPDQLDLFNTF